MLKLDGKPFTLNPISPAVTKLGEELRKLPKDEVFTSGELAKRLRVNNATVTRSIAAYPEHYRRWRGKSYWGSLEAIKAFDKVTQ